MKNKHHKIQFDKMTIIDLAKGIVVIANESNNKGSFQMGNKKWVQFSDTFDETQMVSAGNTAFQKAYQDDNLKQFVDPATASVDNPLTVNSQQIAAALPAEETSMEIGIKVAFLIAQAQGVDVKGNVIDNAFTLARYGSDALEYTFTDGGQWPI